MTGGTDTTTEAEPIPAGARRLRRLVVAVVVVAVLASAFAALVIARRRSPAVDADAGPSACASLPTSLTDAGAPATMRPDDVLFHAAVASSMAGWAGPYLVIGRSGDVIALNAGEPNVTYRVAQLDAASVAAWRACLDSRDFRDLDNIYGEQGRSRDGKFCSVSDLTTSVISAGPASSGTKLISVYDLEGYASRNVRSCLERPRTLSDLHESISSLITKVRENGTPAENPGPELAPL